MDIKNKNLQYLKGVGESRQKLFTKLGITSIDLLFCHYPRKYIDFSESHSVSDTSIVDSALYRLKVLKKYPTQRLYGGRSLTKVDTEGEGQLVSLIYFNNIYTPSGLEENKEYLFYGRIIRTLISCEISNPWLIKENEINKLLPVYTTTEGLSSKQIEKTVSVALSDYANYIEETLPSALLKQYNLISRREAVIRIHQPVSYDDVEKARRRLIFEELLVLLLGMYQFKERVKQKTSIQVIDNISSSFIESLPFRLTDAQLRCVSEILSDMKQYTPMNRLLQGDVGSGKTVVATIAALVVINCGYQVAVMVPTEILALQHFNTFSKLLSPFDISIELLTGAVKGKKRDKILESIDSGTTKLIIGTHALISKDVIYHNLGLVVADEQHRFGVEQRDSLTNKGINPHLLVMSATPIPRTLALFIYGNLDISIINELPKGRIPIHTYYVNDSYRKRYLNFVKQQIDKGYQAYIVCSLVDENKSFDDRLAASEYKKQLEEEDLRGYSIGLIHGRIKASEKASVMKQFSEGKISILVSTTVIEVGLNVPNATVMIIENAENYGLSTLHQLRGRIGRGCDESYCILVSKSIDEGTIDRLEYLTKNTDGFKIAKYDLSMRGPGELIGKRQHGLPNLKIADLTHDEKILHETQKAAKSIFPRLFEYVYLKQEINDMFTTV